MRLSKCRSTSRLLNVEIRDYPSFRGFDSRLDAMEQFLIEVVLNEFQAAGFTPQEAAMATLAQCLPDLWRGNRRLSKALKSAGASYLAEAKRFHKRGGDPEAIKNQARATLHAYLPVAESYGAEDYKEMIASTLAAEIEPDQSGIAPNPDTSIDDAPSPAPPDESRDRIRALRELSDLLDEGRITESEFQQLKRDLLSS